MVIGSAGEQLDGQQLYERQKKLLTSSTYSPAPMIVADHLSIPENIGSVLRLADAVGSKGVIFINDSGDQNLGRVRRTARSCETVVKWKLKTFVDFLEQDLSGVDPLVAIELTRCSKSIFETILPPDCTFIIGNERHGISAGLLEKCQQAVHIPMYGVNGSMNVTHALAIVLFEWRRQQEISCYAHKYTEDNIFCDRTQ